MPQVTNDQALGIGGSPRRAAAGDGRARAPGVRDGDRDAPGLDVQRVRVARALRQSRAVELRHHQRPGAGSGREAVELADGVDPADEVFSPKEKPVYLNQFPASTFEF